MSNIVSDVISRGMGTWKTKAINKGNKRSFTHGKLKGPACQADGIKKSMAKNSRSYKIQPEYNQWCKDMDFLNFGAKKGK